MSRAADRIGASRVRRYASVVDTQRLQFRSATQLPDDSTPTTVNWISFPVNGTRLSRLQSLLYFHRSIKPMGRGNALPIGRTTAS